MGERRQPVAFVGENPGMRLFKSGSEQVVAVASYWYCRYSAAGVGQVLVLWVDEAEAGLDTLAPQGVYTDNLALATLLNQSFTRHFAEFQGVDVAGLASHEAHLDHAWDGQRFEVACVQGGRRVRLAWEGVLECRPLLWPRFEAGTRRFDLSTVLLPCASATIEVEGQAVRGEARTRQAGDALQSSAFLAFGEVWAEASAEG